MGNIGPKFLLPLCDDSQKLSCKRNARWPAKSIVAQSCNFSQLINGFCSLKNKTVKKSATKQPNPQITTSKGSHYNVIGHSKAGQVRGYLDLPLFCLSSRPLLLPALPLKLSVPWAWTRENFSPAFPQTLSRAQHVPLMSLVLLAFCEELWFCF